MEVSGLNAGSSDVLDIYSKKVTTEVEQTEKLAKINIELDMKESQMELAYKALLDFYA